MAYDVQALVFHVLQIAEQRPTYREGGTGKDGTCDCIGLIIGAMYAMGRKKYPMHSTNYFARFQMKNLLEITSELDCRLGMVVYKARDSTADLNARYQPGGRYYTGDMRDYYHVGVVTSVMPLRITHCTSGGGANGIKTDYAIGEWRYGGELIGLNYTQNTNGGDAMEVLYRATVNAPSGSTVNLRESPRTDGKLLDRVPIGTEADVWEDAQGWSHIRTDSGQVGYMQSKFLQKTEELEERPEAETVAVLLPKSAAKALFDALKKEFAKG